MKVALCAIAKLENNYIVEWTKYHLNIGFDKIFIYDNNDNPGECINDVLPNSEHVEVIDFRNKKYAQRVAYTKCFKEHKNEFDWIAFIDIDEFIVFKDKSMTIKDFLNRDCVKNENVIRLNWKHFSDNNLLDIVNDDYSVMNRFTEVIKCKKDTAGKSIVNTKILYNDWIGAHGPHNIYAVDENGNECKNTNYIINDIPSYNIAWINHYATKSIGEYIRQKWFRGAVDTKKFENRYNNFEHFFEYNLKTDEKIQYGQKILNEYEDSSLLCSKT